MLATDSTAETMSFVRVCMRQSTLHIPGMRVVSCPDLVGFGSGTKTGMRLDDTVPAISKLHPASLVPRLSSQNLFSGEGA